MNFVNKVSMAMVIGLINIEVEVIKSATAGKRMISK